MLPGQPTLLRELWTVKQLISKKQDGLCLGNGSRSCPLASITTHIILDMHAFIYTNEDMWIPSVLLSVCAYVGGGSRTYMLISTASSTPQLQYLVQVSGSRLGKRFTL